MHSDDLSALRDSRTLNHEAALTTILLPLVALFSSMGILLVGNGLLGTLLGIEAVRLNFSVEVIGMVMAAYAVGFVFGSLRCTDLIETVGHIRTFAALASVASAATLAHILFDLPLVWAVLRMITGFCFAGLYMVIESWLNEQADNTNRGRILSIYMMVVLSSLAAGQLLLLLPDPGGFELFCIASVLISLGLVPVTLSRASAPVPRTPQRMTLSSLYQASPLGMAGSFVSGLALGAFWSMSPVFCRTLGLSDAATAYFMASTILGGIALLWPVGKLSDKLGRRRVIILACVASGFASLAIVLIGSQSTNALLGLAAAWGGFTFPIYSLSVAHTNDFLEKEKLISASSGLLLVYGAGAIVGPLLTGLAMGYGGAAGHYAILTMIMGFMVLFALYRTRVRPPLPLEAQETVVLVPRTTHVAYELDPRVDLAEDEPTGTSPEGFADIEKLSSDASG